MKEVLYTIPVHEAFEQNTECPLCTLSVACESEYLDSLLRSAYMEPDCRIRTNRLGFCAKHEAQMFERKNRLGMALMLDTHMKDVISRLEGILNEEAPKKKIHFLKKPFESGSASALRESCSSCYLCDQIRETVSRYAATILHLFESDPAFAEQFSACKGFCLPHTALLLEASEKKLSGNKAEAFRKALAELELASLRRVEKDLEWFTLKFDYRNENKPWGESRDAVERAANKLRGACCGDAARPAAKDD